MAESESDEDGMAYQVSNSESDEDAMPGLVFSSESESESESDDDAVPPGLRKAPSQRRGLVCFVT